MIPYNQVVIHGGRGNDHGLAGERSHKKEKQQEMDRQAEESPQALSQGLLFERV